MTETGIKAQIDQAFRKARLERDEPTKTVIGMLKNKVLMELKSGSNRQEDDALWLEVLAGYAKQQRKALVEFEKVGERSADAKQEAEFEIAFCESFLPQRLDEAATEALIRKAAEEHDIRDAKQIGKLMGILMKQHRDEIDGDLARRVASRILTPAE